MPVGVACVARYRVDKGASVGVYGRSKKVYPRHESVEGIYKGEE